MILMFVTAFSHSDLFSFIQRLHTQTFLQNETKKKSHIQLRDILKRFGSKVLAEKC